MDFIVVFQICNVVIQAVYAQGFEFWKFLCLQISLKEAKQSMRYIT